LALFTRITVHLYALHAVDVLTGVELDLALADVRRTYVRAQPTLADLLPEKDD